MPSAADDVREAIALANGAISFVTFMELALYGPHGFYTLGGSAGRRGDFITSPEVGPLFGAVLAQALDTWWRELDCPDPFTVVDAGAGPGTLARTIAIAEPQCLRVMRYVAVEISAAQRSLHPDWVESVATMPTEAFVGVVIANELLDNLPFRLLVHDGGWREAFVVNGTNGDFAEVLGDLHDSDELALPSNVALGARMPMQQRAGAWVRSTLDLLRGGRLVVFDYAAATSADVAGQPWRRWLRTFAGHQRAAHYLRDVGRQDITADVVIDQLRTLSRSDPVVQAQHEFLRLHGIDELVQQGQQSWTAQAAQPSLESIRMRSRVSEAHALTDPVGLGRFAVLTWNTPPR